MMYVLYGAAGMLLVLALVAGGFAAGWQARKAWQAHTRKAADHEATEEERRAILAQQKAFESMLNYNAETAYGMAGGMEELRRGDV